MVAFSHLAATTAVLSATTFAAPNLITSLRRDDDPLGSSLPADTDRGKCVDNDYSSDAARESVWAAARGSNLIDAYLNQNSREHWVGDLWKKIFPEENANQLECLTKSAECTINTHTCADFEEHNAAGFYQVFVSLQNFHTFVKEYLEELQDMCASSTRMVTPIAAQFARGEEEEPVNVMAIMSGVLSMAALAAERSPPAGAALDAMSAIAGFIGEYAQEDSNIPSDQITEAGLQSMLDNVCNTSKTNILKVLEAAMGAEGSSEADIPHEMKMKEGEGLNYQHAISYLFGNGQWLQDEPTKGLKTLFEDNKIKMQRGLAWQVLKIQHHAVLIINDASPCTDANEVRDPDNGYCYGMMRLSDDLQNVLGGIGDAAAPLWASTDEKGYDLDKLDTYRNALDCWLDNDAQIGAIEPHADMRDTSAPKCFFGMEVKKGSWKDWGNGEHSIELDTEFPNFHDDNADTMWPFDFS